jgi:hypothetical protein
MKALRFLRRPLAISLLILFVGQLATPTVSYALTAGPTAPEFSSFEPVDTTDMVNLATGDFIYNTPIIEVPGPEGGYPLSLSYHAGIKNDQEASWVGLGWTLNPGAINRSVNAYPDDSNESKRKVKDYWDGGASSTRVFSVGATIASMGFGMNYSLAKTQDTYKGFSTNATVGYSFNPVQDVFKGKLGIAGGHLSKKLALDYSISSNGDKAFNVAGIPIYSSQKNNSAGRISSWSSSKERWTIMLPTKILSANISLRDFYTRYWSDEAQSLFTYGSLYPGDANAQITNDHYERAAETEFQTYAFDTYDMFDNEPFGSDTESPVNNFSDPAAQVGGTLPAYDDYTVLGQGTGGSIAPFIFETGDLFGQSLYNRDFDGQPVKEYPLLAYESLRPFTTKKVAFRFVNDFSNGLNIQQPAFTGSDATLAVGTNSITANPDGFNNTDDNQKLAGSRHVEWFTNEEIAANDATGKGFMDYYEDRSDRELDFELYDNYLQPESCIPYNGNVSYGRGLTSFKTDSYDDTDVYENMSGPEFYELKPNMIDLRKKIGGFMVTNESGVTYHYALPVYAYNEYTRSKLKNSRKSAATFREQKNDDPYAYSWLLTAITGPDFVDTNTNGTIDNEDVGYWVKFEYGRWADSYQWRTPHSGYMDDLEAEYQTFSYGIKELYYLDAVETRSHKAIFIKSKKKDGRGVTSRLEGGSKPRRYQMHFKWDFDTKSANLNFQVSPVATMKLDGIYLFDKNTLATLNVSKERGEMYNEAPFDNPKIYPFTGDDYDFLTPWRYIKRLDEIKNGIDGIKVKYHNPKLVYDNDDIHDMPQFEAKALRVVKFDTDYSLSGGVPNSIGYLSDFSSPGCDQTLGEPASDLDNRIGNDFEWPTSFGGTVSTKRCYPTPFNVVNNYNIPLCNVDNQRFYNSMLTNYGNLIDCSEAESKYAGKDVTYLSRGKLSLKSVKFLGVGGADLLPPTTFAYGENPNYSTNKYDDWGFYKSDYATASGGIASRKVTATSADHADAWNLAEINTPIGSAIKVQYEPNTFKKAEYNDFTTLSIDRFEVTTTNDVKVYFKDKNIALTEHFSVNDPVDLHAAFVVHQYFSYDGGGLLTGIGASSDPQAMLDAAYAELKTGHYGAQGILILAEPTILASNTSTDKVTAIQSDYITISSASLKAQLILSVDDAFNAISYFISGFIKTKDPAIEFAGGSRVKTLSIYDASNEIQSAHYDYSDPSGPSSSGITAYKPYNMASVLLPVDHAFFDKMATEEGFEDEMWKVQLMKSRFQNEITKPYKDVLTYIHNAPPPGSIYETVKVSYTVGSVETDNYEVNHFRVFDKDMITKTLTNEPASDDVDSRHVVIESNISGIGAQLDNIVYNSDDDPVTTTTYNYLYDNNMEPFEESIQETQQGVTEQSFHKRFLMKDEKLTVKWTDAWYSTTHGGHEEAIIDTKYTKRKAVVTKRKDITDVMTSVTKIDHKKNITSIDQNLDFDFYSGQPTKKKTNDSYGQNYVSITEPAYRKYPDMGLRVFEVLNKNMLTQSASTSSFKLNGEDDPGLIAASTQTWSNSVSDLTGTPSSSVWRKQKSFNWNGNEALAVDGTYPFDDFNSNPFSWTTPESSSGWEKSEEVTLYDKHSHILETADINGNRSSNKLDPADFKTIASTVNGGYYETASSGVEFSDGNSLKEGDVDRGAGSVTASRSHTGKYSLLVNSGNAGFNYTLQSGKADLTKRYLATVWMYASGDGELQAQLDNVGLSYIVGGVEKKATPILQKNKSKNWYLITLVVDPGGAQTQIKCFNGTVRGVFFDDFRVHPIDGSMTTYVYDNLTNDLTYILDANNLYTHFEYDKMGRLIKSSKELMNFDFGPGKESFRADHNLGEVKYNYGKNN